jgi:pantothenate kinase type III
MLPPLLLAADVGNTRAHVGIVRGGGVIDAVAIPIAELDTFERCAAGFASRVRAEAPAAAAFVSVRAAAVAPLRDAIRRIAGLDAVQLGIDRPIPVVNRTARPEQVGADRLVNALAAHARVRGACVVVAAGTALVVDAVAPDGAFLGGAILPGLRVQARALHDHCAQLPDVWEEGEGFLRRPQASTPAAAHNPDSSVGASCTRDPLAPAHKSGMQFPPTPDPSVGGVGPDSASRSTSGGVGTTPIPPAIGRTTDDAILSGLVLGLAGAVRRLVDDVRGELGVPAAPLLLTGGDAPLLRDLLSEGEFVPHLTLEGIARAYALA